MSRSSIFFRKHIFPPLTQFLNFSNLIRYIFNTHAGISFHFHNIIMALTLLPTELLEIIIMIAMPEGFESMAVTCKRCHAVCTRYTKEYNRLRSQFRYFEYDWHFNFPKRDLPSVIRTAADLIARIAVDPRIARHIRSADFDSDSYRTHKKDGEWIPNLHDRTAEIELFADSPYLAQAGLNWQEYYAEIEEDRRAERYSQHAATFLLTLLPNVEYLRLPRRWKNHDATEKLLSVVSRKVKTSHLPQDKPSLGHVSECSLPDPRDLVGQYDSHETNPFLALPRLRSFPGPISIPIVANNHTSMLSQKVNEGFAPILVQVHFVSYDIDDVGITDFLRHSPNLKRLRYVHTAKDPYDRQGWDLCKFMTVIECEV